MVKTDKKLEEALERLTKEKHALLKIREHKKTAVIKPMAKNSKSEATAVTLLSDVHFEEEVKASAVFGRNHYSLEIAKERMNEYFYRVARMIRKEQQDVIIKNCVIHLGGDFISGNIHEELLSSCKLPPIKAILRVKELISGGIEYLLANTDVDFVFVCSAGNHARITSKVNYSNEQGNSLEWFMYFFLAEQFRKETRVQFVMSESYHTYLTVYDRTLRFHHGHQVKYQGGVGGITIPLNKAIAQWNTIYRADIDFLGHLHQHMMQNNFVVNGSMIGYNAYSIAVKASFEAPKQAFVLLDRDRGLTVSMPILFSQ